MRRISPSETFMSFNYSKFVHEYWVRKDVASHGLNIKPVSRYQDKTNSCVHLVCNYAQSVLNMIVEEQIYLSCSVAV